MYHINQLTILYKPWLGKMTSPGGQDAPARDGVKNDCFIFLRPSHGEEIPDQVRDDSIDQVYFTEHTVPSPYESIKSQI